MNQLVPIALATLTEQRLAAIRHLFEWFVTGQVVPVNPAPRRCAGLSTS